MRWRAGIRFVVFVALYWVGAALATSFVDRDDQVALIWPSSALSFCTLLLYGLRWWIATPVAVVLVHLTIAPVSPLFLGFSVLANTLGALTGATLVRLLAPNAAHRLSVRSGFELLRAGALGAATSSLIGSAGMVIAGMVDREALWPTMAKWALADLFGIVALGPAILLFGRRQRLRDLRRLSLGFAPRREKWLWALVLFASIVVFLGAGEVSVPFALGLSALPMAAILWAAVRFEPLYAATATAVFALVATSAVGHGFGGYEPPSTLADAATLLAFMSLLAVIPQMLSGVAHQNRMAAQNLIERATTDAATGLANRSAFEDRAREAIAESTGEPMALAYVDLDQFKVVNDTFSHAAGDRLIRALAGVLRTEVGEDELLARTGGDEFGLLLRRCDAAAASRRAASLHERIAAFRFSDGDHALTPAASIGLVPFVAGARDFAELLAQADAACFTAKERGGNRVQLATTEGGEVAAQTESMRWATVVAQALEFDRFVLFGQSITALKPGLGGPPHLEILLRMREPAGDALLAPGNFVPAAERFGLGERLDRHVIDRVLTWFEERPQCIARVGGIAINLTAAAVESEGFGEFLGRRLERSRVPPSLLCLELTETSAVQDLSRAQRLIAGARALGCRIALDDFGTGFCSFAYLKSLQADYFKIDASFVRELAESAPALAIVRSIADIAHVMDRRTVAEGVESDAVRERLVALGVDYAQGYAIHRPEPLEAYFARAG
jgi:diguanylate cyclase (GGDEF)-like protein